MPKGGSRAADASGNIDCEAFPAAVFFSFSVRLSLCERALWGLGASSEGWLHRCGLRAGSDRRSGSWEGLRNGGLGLGMEMHVGWRLGTWLRGGVWEMMV